MATFPTVKHIEATSSLTDMELLVSKFCMYPINLNGTVTILIIW